MKLKILTIGVISALFFSSFIVTANNTIFRDDFDSKSSHWAWYSVRSGYHLINDGIVEITVPHAFRICRHESALVTNCTQQKQPYRYNNMYARIRFEGTLKGSRGWGFWNTVHNPFNYSFAWFMYQKGSPLNPLNGFWVMSTDGLLKGFQLKRIKGYDLSEWHDYGINWTEESVSFYIDGDCVANFTSNVPRDYCRIHIWNDNAFYAFIPIYQRFLFSEKIFVDWFEITE